MSCYPGSPCSRGPFAGGGDGVRGAQDLQRRRAAGAQRRRNDAGEGCRCSIVFGCACREVWDTGRPGAQLPRRRWSGLLLAAVRQATQQCTGPHVLSGVSLPFIRVMHLPRAHSYHAPNDQAVWPVPPPSPQVTMSTLTEDGIAHVKQVACDRLLSSRVEVKLKVCCAVLRCAVGSCSSADSCSSGDFICRGACGSTLVQPAPACCPAGWAGQAERAASTPGQGREPAGRLPPRPAAILRHPTASPITCPI